MSAARLDKLRALLKRVEQRSGQPRLRAVQTPQAAVPSAPEDPELSISTASDTLPPGAPDDFSFDSEAPEAPDTLPPPAESAPTQRALEAVQVAPSSLPPAPEPAAERALTPAPATPARPAVKSPIEDAMALLPDLGSIEDSGPLRVQALAEPITTPERGPSEAPAADPHLTVTHRPQATPSLPEVTFIPASPAPVMAPSGGVREPTIEFAVRPQPGAVPRSMEPVLLERAKEPEISVGPSQTLEAPPLATDTPPTRTLSAARLEEPKSFGELLELSLSLRP